MSSSINKTITISAEAPAVNLLSDATGLSRTTVKDAMTKGAVWSNKSGRTTRLRRAKTILQPGTLVSIHYSASILAQVPKSPILIEDLENHSIWVKPAGLLSGGSRYGDHCAINRVVEKELDRPTFLVHRLDRFVWGVMVLAHSKKTAAELSRQFESRETEKIYRAVVHGRITEQRTINSPIEGKEALSRVTPVLHSEHHTLVEIRIETGRKHQIRQHLSMIGHPIRGDRQYGSPDLDGILLASIALGLTNLDGKFVRYELPEELHPQLPNGG